MEISELLEQTSKLPNVPDVVKELIQDLNNPNAKYDEIAKKVGKDQTLSLRVLRLVNSAHFGLSRKVSSIDEAVVMLGMARLKTMVIASGLVGSVKELEGLDLMRFWGETFNVATAAKWFAEQSEAEDADPDLAFTAGLLHNIGRLLLHLTKPKLAQAIQARVDESECSRSEAELERLGFVTPQAGKALLDMWKFPAELGEAVEQFKAPGDYEETNIVAACVNLGCIINSAKRNELDAEAVLEKWPEDIAKLAGLPELNELRMTEVLALESGLEGMSA